MKKRYIAIAVLLLLIPMLAGAQALKGSYFIDNSMNRHRMNPAFTPRANYFQLPVIGNTSVAFGTNLDVDSFLYPRDGQLLTFLNPNVSVDEFQSNFPSTPHLDFEVNSNLLSFGFFTKKKAFWNFDLDMRVMTDVDLPSDLFLFLKKGTGTSGETFNIGNVNMYATGAVQAALGYSRDITKGLRLGIKARAIAPLAYAGVNLENSGISTLRDMHMRRCRDLKSIFQSQIRFRKLDSTWKRCWLTRLSPASVTRLTLDLNIGTRERDSSMDSGFLPL